MTASSEHSAIIRGYSSTLGVAQGPVDAGMARDAIVNNAIHLHDESGQSLFTMTEALGASWVQASPSTSTFQLLDHFPIPEFPLRQRADGTSFRVIITARVAISSAGTATFRVALHPADAVIDSRYPPAVIGTTVDEFTTTSTTGETIEVDALYLTATQMTAARRRIKSLRGDGSLGSGHLFLGAISVWAKASAGGPVLYSICGREFVG